ncbi:uncharacterized protein [Watersipora subatra]|uniref:uncharacterized protein n=1 Tax=Watersipora subatra TaxID=2589382 RepID=UPI00355B4EC3
MDIRMMWTDSGALLKKGLVCYSCVNEDVNMVSERCNNPNETIACSSSDDVCVTETQKFDFKDNTYSKGCMNIERCSSLESVGCKDPAPIKCWACCAHDLCNNTNDALKTVNDLYTMSLFMLLTALLKC